MLEKVHQEYPELIEEVRVIGSGQLEEIMGTLLPKYAPTLWGTNEQRLKEYLLQLDHIKKKKIPIRLSKEFKLVKLPSFIKSEDVISVIKDSNFAEFKKLVPESIAPEFFNLQRELNHKMNESYSKLKDDAEKDDAEII
jgi:hypothetical protein